MLHQKNHSRAKIGSGIWAATLAQSSRVLGMGVKSKQRNYNLAQRSLPETDCVKGSEVLGIIPQI